MRAYLLEDVFLNEAMCILYNAKIVYETRHKKRKPNQIKFTADPNDSIFTLTFSDSLNGSPLESLLISGFFLLLTTPAQSLTCIERITTLQPQHRHNVISSDHHPHHQQMYRLRRSSTTLLQWLQRRQILHPRMSTHRLEDPQAHLLLLQRLHYPTQAEHGQSSPLRGS